MLRKYACIVTYYFLWLSFTIVYFEVIVLELCWPPIMGWKMFPTLIFWKNLYKGAVIFFFNICKATQILCFICVKFGKLYVFYNFVHFIWVTKFVGKNSFKYSFIFPFKTCIFYSNAPYVFPGIDNLSSFFLFLNQYS